MTMVKLWSGAFHGTTVSLKPGTTIYSRPIPTECQTISLWEEPVEPAIQYEVYQPFRIRTIRGWRTVWTTNETAAFNLEESLANVESFLV